MSNEFGPKQEPKKPNEYIRGQQMVDLVLFQHGELGYHGLTYASKYSDAMARLYNLARTTPVFRREAFGGIKHAIDNIYNGWAEQCQMLRLQYPTIVSPEHWRLKVRTVYGESFQVFSMYATIARTLHAGLKEDESQREAARQLLSDSDDRYGIWKKIGAEDDLLFK